MDYSNINFKKKFGQNFLKDKNLLKAIVSDANVQKDDIVVEIGPGAGALTEYLVESAKKVYAFEIDTELKPELDSKFFGKENIEIIFEDFLNIDEEFLLNKTGENYKVVANLPYYITSPILTKLFSLKHRPKTIVVMVQKEVGERITATKDQGEYGYFSAYITLNANSKITRHVNRKMFTPVPNVDSCVVKLDLKNDDYDEKFVNFLKSAFQMKRKTLKNNIEKAYGLKKEKIDEVLVGLNHDVSVRADSLSVEELNEIYINLFNWVQYFENELKLIYIFNKSI